MKKYELKSLGAIIEAMRDGATVLYENCMGVHVVIEVHLDWLICDDNTRCPAIPRAKNGRIYVNL